MTCDDVEQALAAYHFGVVSDTERADLEAHLLICRACLKGFLDTKRAIETAEDGPAPSQLARQRLRRAVARELGACEPAWSWWDRPLAFGFAGAALLAAMFATRVVTTGPGVAPHGMPRVAAPDASPR